MRAHPERIQGVTRTMIVVLVTEYLVRPLMADWPIWLVMLALVPYVIIALEFIYQPRREHGRTESAR
jgi:hypothetical protein